MTTRIPLLRPCLPTADELLPYLKEIDQSAWYSNFGPLNERFVKRIETYQKQRWSKPVFGLTTTSGTVALELLISSLELPQPSNILIPAFTFVATASAVLRCGHKPVLCDVDPQTWLLTPEMIPSNLDWSAVGAVIPVATFGMPQPVDLWQLWHQKTGVPVIIDAAAGFGAQSTSPDIPIAFSLHATKALSTGEGGVIMSENGDLVRRLKQMTNFGMGQETVPIGTNAKLSEYNAAVGNAHFDRWPHCANQRLELYMKLKERVQNLLGDSLAFQKDTGLFAPTIFPVLLRNANERDRVERQCGNMMIETRRWYQPIINKHSAFKVQKVAVSHSLSNTEVLENCMVGLPFYEAMSDNEIEQVIAALTCS